MENISSSGVHLMTGREFHFCPSCDARLRNREYKTLITRAFGLSSEYRWQCLDCGYRERGRKNYPLALCFSGMVLALSSFALTTGYIPDAWVKTVDLSRKGLQLGGGVFFAMGLLIFFFRLIKAKPVIKISCVACDKYFRRNDSWSNSDYCSGECAEAANEEEEIGEDSEDMEDADEEDIEDIEEVDDEDDIEDVDDETMESAEDVDDDVMESADDTDKEASHAESDGDLDSVKQDEEIAEMVLFDDKHEEEEWDPNEILASADEGAGLDNLDDVDVDVEDEEEEVHEAMNLMESRRLGARNERTAIWSVKELLDETADLELELKRDD